MKIRLKFVVLLWLGVCLLGCVSTTGTKAPSSPTSSPTWTPTSSPQETPVASPTVFSSPTPLPTARPSLTPSPTPATQVDPDDTSVTYAERPAWRALLGWPDACEEGFELHARQADDEGGIVIYPLDDKRYLILVTCTLGPYWVEERVYWLDASASPPAALSLAVPELIQDDAPEQGLHEVDVLHGAFPTYHPDTQTLTNLHAYRGLKDCGVFYKYHLEDTYFVLDEAHYRDCESGIDTLMPGEWPLVYPLPTFASPFRKVAPLDPALLAGDIDVQALPDGGLRVMTNIGYATYRDGQWETQLVDEGQTLVGVDADERAWILGETGNDIYYQKAGSELAPAAAGWTPIANPPALRGRGVVSDDQGRVWLATEQDVRVFDGKQWTIFTREAMGMSPASYEDLMMEFTLTYVASRQQMWVGSCDWGGPGPFGGGGARWFDGQAWRGAQSPVAGGCVTAIAADAEGRVWIGLQHGLVRLFDQTTREWHEFLLPEPVDYRRGYPAALSLGPDGAPWLLAALCGGASCDAMRALYHLQDNTWIEVLGLQDYHEDLYQGSTLPVLFDEAGTPWFLFGGMAFRIEDNRLEQPAVVELNVWDATTDVAGQIWVVANTRNDSPALWVLEGDK